MTEAKTGEYLFIAGVVITIVLGLASPRLDQTSNSWLMSILIVLGILVGWLNVQAKDTKELLLVSVALAIVSMPSISQKIQLEKVEIIGAFLAGLFSSILVFIVPMAITASLKMVWEMTKGRKS